MYFIGLCRTRAPNSVRALLETIHHTFCSSEPCRTACLDGAASLVFLTPHLVFLLRCEASLCVFFFFFVVVVVWCWGPSCNGSKMMFLCNHIKKGEKIETECIYQSSFYGLKSIDTGRWCPYGSAENPPQLMGTLSTRLWTLAAGICCHSAPRMLLRWGTDVGQWGLASCQSSPSIPKSVEGDWGHFSMQVGACQMLISFKDFGLLSWTCTIIKVCKKKKKVMKFKWQDWTYMSSQGFSRLQLETGGFYM